MFTRRSDRKSGEYIRRALQPMADRLGLDYETSFFTPPHIAEALAFETYRCGVSLLMGFTYPDGWGTTTYLGDQAGGKLAKKTARQMRRALLGPTGPDAISQMAQEYARDVAEFWRETAETADPDDAAQLRRSAPRSEHLGELAAKYWPVIDPHSVLKRLDTTTHERLADLASFDRTAKTAARRIDAACRAAAIALAPEFETYEPLLVGPVVTVNMELAAGLQQDWAFNLDHWTNLMLDEPLSYYELLAAQQAQLE